LSLNCFVQYLEVIKTTNNRPTLVNKFQGFSFDDDDVDRAEKTASSTTSDSRCLIPTEELTGTKGGVRVFKATSAIVSQARAFYFFFVYFFFAKDCVWILLYELFFHDVKKELIISSESSK
jgi:hypothetical protein